MTHRFLVVGIDPDTRARTYFCGFPAAHQALFSPRVSDAMRWADMEGAVRCAMAIESDQHMPLLVDVNTVECELADRVSRRN